MDGCTAAPNTLQEAVPSLVWDSESCLPCLGTAGPWGWQGTVLLNNKCYFLIQPPALNELCPCLGSDFGAEREFPLLDLIGNAL